ncbi:MAG: MFS transporter [Anaerolineae bacterium]|nr:MFS transporter [Anaerolineae bacterium]
MFSIYQRKWDARRVYLILSSANALFFTLVFAANMVYQVETVGLTPLQLVLVGTTLEVAVFLFEVPTGIVADVYSRRLSIIIGCALIGVGFMVEGSFPVFGAILLAQVLWGIGYTFTSGATQAWITDEIGEEAVGPVFMRAAQLGNLSAIVATILAIVLGSLLINLPIVLGGLMLIATAVFLILVMPETGFKPTPREDRTTWGQMRHTFKDGLRTVRRSTTLLAILGIGLFYGLFSEGYDRLNTAHLLESFTLPDFGGLQPIAWMGILGIIGNLLSAGAMQILNKRIDMTHSAALARASFVVSGLMVATLAGFAMAGTFAMAVIMRWAFGVMRSVIEPLQDAWINQHIDSSVRATVISMRGQVDAIGQMGGGPPVGIVGERLGIRAALIASSIILSPVLILYTRLLRKEKNAPAIIPAEEGVAP